MLWNTPEITVCVANTFKRVWVESTYQWHFSLRMWIQQLFSWCFEMASNGQMWTNSVTALQEAALAFSTCSSSPTQVIGKVTVEAPPSLLRWHWTKSCIQEVGETATSYHKILFQYALYWVTEMLMLNVSITNNILATLWSLYYRKEK